MSERKQFRAIKGTRDILPPDSALWNWFEHTAREVFESYNSGEIRLPIFEETELFARSIGADTDVVYKEMYTFRDRPDDLEQPGTFGEIGSHIQTLKKMLREGTIPSDDHNVLVIETLEQVWNSASIPNRWKLKRAW